MAGDENQDTTGTPRGPGGRRKKDKNSTTGRKASGKKTSTQADLEAKLAKVEAELAATKASLDKASRGNNRGDDGREPVERIERPPGEAGDSAKGFRLQAAMDLEDDDEKYEAILRTVHNNTVRVNLDPALDFRRQDPAKLATLYKLTRDAHKPDLSEERFPLSWPIAEMVKQYIRNKRKYMVRKGRMANRADRKREREESLKSGPSKKRRRLAGGVPHIDDQRDSDEETGQDDDDDQEEHTAEG
ncbi:hypothetical protein C8F04DRAFT_1116389 [Mycena alexandri]|uniref:Uncharacterized protein n=1 Tax=Mycena alexandri TaxID=1745969 RepID=A0AAD6SKW4_9AGAR|nr:hypothetical protein C8F04DRAFT_1116389 [Mycena alexandri]